MNIDYIRSLRWIDYIYYTILDPRMLARLIIQSEKHFLPVTFVIPVLTAASGILSVSLLRKQSSFFLYKISYGWILLSIVIIGSVFFLVWLIETALQLSNRGGKLKAEITLVNLSCIPMIFMLPSVTIFVVLNFAPVFFFFLLMILFFIWSYIIVVLGISEMHGLSYGRASAVCLIPSAVFSIVIILSSVLVAALSFGLLKYFLV
jgi:hypothetical protein